MPVNRSPGNHALSLVEVLIAVVIIGLSTLPVIELVRSGTARLEVTEIEAAARQLGADVIERLAGPRLGEDRGLAPAFAAMKKTRVRWSVVVEADDALKHGYPAKELAALLDLHDVGLALDERDPFEHPAIGPSRDLVAYVVTVDWADANDERKKVTFARLVDR